MAVYPPKPHALNGERELLKMLREMLRRHLGSIEYDSGNRDPKLIELSERETKQLLQALDTLLRSRNFQDKVDFVDRLRSPQESAQELAKHLFVTGVKIRGRAINIHSNRKWRDFLLRLGVVKNSKHGDNVRPLDFAQFCEMEDRLLEFYEFHELERQFVVKTSTRSSKHAFEELRGERIDRPHVSSKSLRERLDEFANTFRDNRLLAELSTNRLVGLTTLVANSTVIFTTRDWGVAGVASTMSGAFTMTAHG